jgi:hypothetical protein
MHAEAKAFCMKIKELYPDAFKNKKVLDVWSLDVNWNNRFLFDDCEYLWLDVGEWPNVDIICSIHEYKPEWKFGTIISTEMLEHNKYRKESLQNMYDLLEDWGVLVLTCATTGRAEHGTTRTSVKDSPYTTDYYMNIEWNHIMEAFEGYEYKKLEISYNNGRHDLYLLLIK